MKICITSSGPSLEDIVDPRFGRCQYFLILESNTMQFEAFQNSAISASGGAGIQSAQFVADKGAEVVLTGNLGPNATNTLQAAGLKTVVGITGITIRQAVQDYKSGKYQEVSSPTVGSKFGMGGGGGGMGKGMGMGRGMGRGMGMGSGIGNINQNQQQSTSQLSKDEELNALKEQSQKMKEELERIQKSIDKLSERKE